MTALAIFQPTSASKGLVVNFRIPYVAEEVTKQGTEFFRIFAREETAGLLCVITQGLDGWKYLNLLLADVPFC